MKICARCDNCRWVCEAHPDRPWLGDCGAAGMPCPVCNPSDKANPPTKASLRIRSRTMIPVRIEATRNFKRAPYLSFMLKFEFACPLQARPCPPGPSGFMKSKWTAYRLRLERDGTRVRLITKGGHDWSSRYPAIVEAALRNRLPRFVIDGEAVIQGADGIPDFNALHSGRHNEAAELCAFDILAFDGDDLRELPLSMRKTNLARLFRGRPEGIFLADFEQGEIGPDRFRKACEFGLEGIVSKRSDRPYRGGRSKDWVKAKNRAHHAFDRVAIARGQR